VGFAVRLVAPGGPGVYRFLLESEIHPLQRPRDVRIIKSRHFRKQQRRHFIPFDVLPFLGTLAALALLLVRPVGVLEISLFFAMWLITGLGITVGYHRLFTHRAFETHPAVSALLIAMGSMAARGPMLWWSAIHRRHHELSDHDGDLHSPNLHGNDFVGRLRGFLHAHPTWMLEPDYPNAVHYVPDYWRSAGSSR
jgi:stearoyl-CoA desaturase (delta-9 desaturase)